MKSEKVNDPVCGMEVDKTNSPKITHNGKDYYFCAPACQWAFKSNPDEFTKEKRKTEG